MIFRVLFGGVLSFVFMCLGVVNYQTYNKVTLEKKLLVKSFQNDINNTLLIVKKNPIRTKNTWVADVELVNPNIDYPLFGKAYFKDSVLPPESGQIIRTSQQIQSLHPPTNPGQFNFAKYSHSNNLFFTIYLSDFDVIGNDNRSSFLDVFKGIQHSCLSVFEKYLKGEELAIAAALVLGDKSYLTADIKKAYSEAGAMHVLAVSGLHVGLVYLLLSYLFKGLGETRKQVIIKTILIVILILFYAGITGFSPSVTRASVMFSLVAIGGIIRRNSSIYNIIFTSAFGMLLWDPSLLFNVSFQLSYIAVIGIIYLHPKIFNLYFPKTGVGYYLWSLICLSLSAQIATFPLALYYFGLFPSWFLLTNLVVVPAAMVELGGGFALLASHFVGLGNQIGFIYSEFIRLVNWIISNINSMPPGAILASLSAFQMVLVYFLIVGIVWWLNTMNRLVLFFLSLTLVCLQVSFVDEEMRIDSQSGVIIYDDRIAVMEVYSGREAVIYADTTQKGFERFEQFVLAPSLKQRSIEIWSIKPLVNVKSASIKLPNSKSIKWVWSKSGIEPTDQGDSLTLVLSGLKSKDRTLALETFEGIDFWDCQSQGYFLRTLE